MNTWHATEMNVSHIRERLLHMHELTDEDEMLEITDVCFLANEESIFGKPNRAYIKREIDWYESKSEYIGDMESPPKRWLEVAGSDGKVSSNYGRRILSTGRDTQFKLCCNELIANRESRRAVMVYADFNTQWEATRHGRDDQLCTLYVSCMIRDHTLLYSVHMRSSDVFWGYPNDRAWHVHVIQKMREYMANYGVELEATEIIWHADSLHVYPRHRHRIKPHG